MKKEVLLFLLNKYADWEAAYLSTAVRSMSKDMLQIKTVSLMDTPVTSAGGLRVIPDYNVNCIPKDYAALILVGGYSWRTENMERLEPVVRDCVIRGIVLGAICDATVYLGAIGILNQIEHTSNDLSDLKSYAKDAYTGAERYIARNVVSDHNIVTANGTAPIDFAREILRILHAAPDETIEEWFLFHRLGCYAVREAQY